MSTVNDLKRVSEIYLRTTTVFRGFLVKREFHNVAGLNVSQIRVWCWDFRNGTSWLTSNTNKRTNGTWSDFKANKGDRLFEHGTKQWADDASMQQLELFPSVSSSTSTGWCCWVRNAVLNSLPLFPLSDLDSILLQFHSPPSPWTILDVSFPGVLYKHLLVEARKDINMILLHFLILNSSLNLKGSYQPTRKKGMDATVCLQWRM